MSEFQKKTIKPSRSVPIRFIGRIIAETEWTTKHDSWMRFTVWETRGGAYIAVTEGDEPGKPDQVHCSVTVVEPINRAGRYQLTEGGALLTADIDRDETAMQIAVLDHFDWHDRAKAMLKRELGWAPVIEVA